MLFFGAVLVWTAGGVSAEMLGLLGVIVSIAPDTWAMLLTRDETVLVHARIYLRWAGPAFAGFGFGLTLYFASQGSGKVLRPVLASTARLALVAAAMLVYGVGTTLAMRVTPWRTTPRAAAPRSPHGPTSPASP